MEVEGVRRYLNDIRWPKDLRVRYTIGLQSVRLYVNQFDFILLPPEDVMQAKETINKTMTWLHTSGWPATLEVE